MASTGNVFPGTGENNAGIGATAWTNPGNVVSDNATDATCNAAASSQYLVARNFAFSSIPANATILGITVRVEASEHSGGTEALRAQLQDAGGALVGSAKTGSNGGDISGTTKAVYTYGGTSDLWGATLTPAIVKDADFGVRFWFLTSHDVRVDFVTIAVEYSVPTPGRADETDTALALTRAKVRAVGRADETDTALALTVRKLIYPDHTSLLASLAAYWPLDEASGTRVDAHDDLDLTDNNTVGQAAGKVGNAGQFVRANNEYLSHADDALLQMGDIDFTVACWVYRDSSIADAGILGRSSGGREYFLFHTGDRFRLYVSSDGGFGAGQTIVESAQVVSNATWYFIVAWHDAASNTINIQVNEGAVDSQAHSGGAFVGTSVLEVGSQFSLHWDGRIDEAAVWRRRLTSDERTALYNSGAGRSYESFYAPSSESETALALSVKKIRATGRADETDTALAPAVGHPTQTIATGRADEADSAFALAATKIRATGIASETDTAFGLAGTKIIAVGRSSETDAAFATLPVRIPVGRADAADTALAPTVATVVVPPAPADEPIRFETGGWEPIRLALRRRRRRRKREEELIAQWISAGSVDT